MDLISFSTLLDPRSLGIYEEVSKALLTQSFMTMDMELYKLNVYGERSHSGGVYPRSSESPKNHCVVGKGDFFKAHRDTPRSQDMFGSLVIVLPTLHQGGQFMLRQGEKEWTIDFADKFATAAEPSVCFVAFFGDIEHEVLPVTSGFRVTLTYNIYHKPGLMHPNTSSIPTPFQLKLKQTLVDLVNDKSKLPKGGYLGFGLVHEYVHTGRKLLEPLLGQLKGSDRALADVCDELGLRYSLRLLYCGIVEPPLNLIATNELEVDAEMMPDYEESLSEDYLRQALEGLTIEEVEGIILVGGRHKFDPRLLDDDRYGMWLRAFYRNPATEVLEITPMKSSVDIKTSFMTYGNEAEFEYFYGTACMLVAVEPAESRDFVEL